MIVYGEMRAKLRLLVNQRELLKLLLDYESSSKRAVEDWEKLIKINNKIKKLQAKLEKADY